MQQCLCLWDTPYTTTTLNRTPHPTCSRMRLATGFPLRDLCCFLGDGRPFCIRIFAFDASTAERESERETEDEGEVGVVDVEKAITCGRAAESVDESGERRPRRAAAVDDAGPGAAAAVRMHRVAVRSVNMAVDPLLVSLCACCSERRPYVLGSFSSSKTHSCAQRVNYGLTQLPLSRARGAQSGHVDGRPGGGDAGRVRPVHAKPVEPFVQMLLPQTNGTGRGTITITNGVRASFCGASCGAS